LIFNKNLLLATILLMGGCATFSPPPTPPTNASVNQKHLATLANIKAFSLKGRLGVVTNPRGFSGGIEWQHQNINDNIDIFSPVGGKVANIAKNPSGVTLTTQDSHSIKANDAESLTEATLGWRLPLSGLSDWAIGRPTASKIETSSWDEQGRLTTLKQDGWDISYEAYIQINGADNNGVFLPSKVVLKSEKVNLKLLVEKWVGFNN
jgi:outer membrane lipoprotein LolB